MKPKGPPPNLSKVAAAITAEVMAQREEILRAFVAKYGFDPDECEQIYENSPQGVRWYVVRLPRKQMRAAQRQMILDRCRRKKFNWWQEFCLYLAGILK